jgi:hypothetical protein
MPERVMHSIFQRIDIELKFLVLRLHVARCRFLVEAESDITRRQQFRQLLGILELAEAGLRGEYDRARADRSAAPQSPSLPSKVTSPMGKTTSRQEHNDSPVVIDLNAARHARPNHLRARSPYFPRLMPDDCEDNKIG